MSAWAYVTEIASLFKFKQKQNSTQINYRSQTLSIKALGATLKPSILYNPEAWSSTTFLASFTAKETQHPSFEATISTDITLFLFFFLVMGNKHIAMQAKFIFNHKWNNLFKPKNSCLSNTLKHKLEIDARWFNCQDFIFGADNAQIHNTILQILALSLLHETPSYLCLRLNLS